MRGRWIMKKFGFFMYILLLIFILSGCKEEVKPEEVFESYIELWQQGDYEQMYDLISESSQAVITKDEFVNRYRTIYKGIEMSDLEVTAVLDHNEEKSRESVVKSIPYHMKMETAAGPIAADGSVQVVKSEEANRWEIAWNPSLLFQIGRAHV